ncbi:MAG: glutamine--fructose-6-phosphate transaminase (isomerizing), partial [Brachymonas sp.]|nr:glutamine--fructose-6-phosphate transaminase (isomerizing) [Brachymonas sp.]
MCGIVSAVAQQNVVSILIQGLQRLEYRGYDSCGVAVWNDGLQRARSTARVAELDEQVQRDRLQGYSGIAHTRWATHGAPAVHNAHPHFSYGSGVDADDSTGKPGRIALVHNGIIENYETLRSQLQKKGYVFSSQTDTEVIAHLIDSLYNGDLFDAVKAALAQLHGAYAVAVICRDEPHRVVGGRAGSPLVMGIGADGAHYLASDAMALAGVTDQIVYLEEGDVVDLQLGKYWIENAGQRLGTAQRPVRTVLAHSGAAELGPFRHYMQKEIFEQPRALADTLEGVATVVPELFGDGAHHVFQNIDRVLILACGTSYYSGCVAKYWLEAIAGMPCDVEIASEYRYRTSVPHSKTLVVTISQSGETADTLAALRHAKTLGMVHTLTICNVATSAMVRECKLSYVTRAGVEIGVASTKAFTTQLAGLFLLTLALGGVKGTLSDQQQAAYLGQMRHLPLAVQAVLALEPQLMQWAESFSKKDNALFLGRGIHYPVALEGALKLKEISYIHA